MIFFGYSLSVSILYTIDVFLYIFSLVMYLIVNFLLYNFVLCFFYDFLSWLLAPIDI